mgnify:CR=1 FL=1
MTLVGFILFLLYFPLEGKGGEFYIRSAGGEIITYERLSTLGGGGYGYVYKVKDKNGNIFTLKRLRPEAEGYLPHSDIIQSYKRVFQGRHRISPYWHAAIKMGTVSSKSSEDMNKIKGDGILPYIVSEFADEAVKVDEFENGKFKLRPERISKITSLASSGSLGISMILIFSSNSDHTMS